jgi:S-formylglutathione hydrolase FrmB
MALCEVRFFSNLLRKQVGMYVILPDAGKPPFATFYLLHGLSDDYTIWQRRTRIEAHVAGLPLIVVLPDGFRGFYTANEQGPDYASYIGVEIPNFIERNFPARPARAARCIGGLSMGGYGALRVALGFADRFISATSHSGAMLAGQQPRRDVGEQAEFRRIFGPSPKGTDHDLLHLAGRAKRRRLLPRLRIDCGTDDFLLDDNRKFHAALRRLRIEHEYEEFAGGHNWDYWEVHVRQAIDFHAKALRLR